MMNVPNIKFKASSISEEGIEIIALDELYARRLNMNHNPNKPHRVHFYLMIYIEQGEGTHFIDFNQYLFKKGSFIFINKNQIQAFSLHDKIKGKAVLFTESYIDKIQTNMNMSVFSKSHVNIFQKPVFTPQKLLLNSCEALFFEIKKEMKHEEKNNQIIMLLFSSIFMLITREITKFQTSRLSNSQIKLFREFIALLHKKLMEERDASYYALKLDISYKTLNNLCKLETNKTVKQFIDMYIILELKRHLILENKQIQEIAYDFNFFEVSNFVKYFKKNTFLTPLQFKKQSKS